MIEVRLEALNKKFGDVVAISNVTLKVYPGEFMVLVGPSGCGKTTLLRLVAGLEQLDSGHIYLGDVWANEIAVGKRNVQMIFQNYALWPHMKVLDEKGYSNISFPLKIRKWVSEQIVNRAQEITRRVGIGEELYSRVPGELSAGQQQRVALSRAITTSPQVFLMDEPMANLDPPSRVKVRKEILQLHKELATTTILVTHIMADAFAMADRIAIMREGRIVQVGTADNLRNYPADDFVKDFLES
ncbi:MAG: ABC transporter ATP-binding protein [Chloroflexota bacterium]